ncbi:hypothetical protein CPB84DRAFT_1749584 [Gymnopilus junonius]|uniref:Uncharacterized protein n=1 Tax=Gymnopilus junonius TaxID=109634 RepID=A0A9P5TKD5_GYMJU|nr:hypothetical protein CPB84DRAFT_1749584 [Gymnopilus junonius]
MKNCCSVTIEEVEDSGKFLLQPILSSQVSVDQRKERRSEEGFIFEDKDGSFTLVGFLEDFEENSLPDFTCDSDQDDDDDVCVEDDYLVIQEISDLEQFSVTLAEAQRVAVQAEHERLRDNNWPKQYSKNTAQMKQCQKKIRKDWLIRSRGGVGQ